MRALAPGTRDGFTLIELLVVIAIIMFLISALFMGLTRLRERTRIGQTRNLLEKLHSALETYHLKFRAYPSPRNALGAYYLQSELLENNEDLYYFMTTGFRQTPDTTRGEVQASINAGPFVTGGFHEYELKKSGTKVHIVDTWGSPVLYRLRRTTFVDPTDPTHTNNIDIPEAYSFGINKQDNQAGGDDIVVGKR